MKFLTDGVVLTDLLKPRDIAIMSNEEWESSEEILRSWGLLCTHQDYPKPHVLALRYWGEIYMEARELATR